MSGFRKLRAALMIALTWGLFWGVAGTTLAYAIVRVFQPSKPFRDGLSQVGELFLLFAAIGGIMGLTFSTIMAVAGRHGGWSLTRGRALLLGAVGGAAGFVLFAIGMKDALGWNTIVTPLTIAIFTGVGAITGVLTFGTVARGRLPAGSDETNRIAD